MQTETEIIRNKKRTPDIFDTGIIFLLSVTMLLLSKLIFSFLFSDKIENSALFYLAIGVLEALTMFLPLALYAAIRKLSIFGVFKSKITIEQATLSVFIGIFGSFVVGAVRIVWVVILIALKIPLAEASLMPIDNVWVFLIATVSISFIPAVSEELLLRGVLQNRFSKRHKPFIAIAMASTLFMLLHTDVSALTYTFLAGVMLGYVLYITKSIWAAIIFHATNNFISVLGQFILTKTGTLTDTYDGAQVGVGDILSNSEAIVIISALVLIAMACLGLTILLFWALKKVSKKEQAEELDRRPVKKFVYVPYIVSIFLLILMIIVPVIYEMAVR